MKKLILIAIIAVIAWQVQARYRAARPTPQSVPTATAHTTAPARASEAPSAFKCDGRTHCSQMSSCAEANYFLQNCPGVKMDGNHDGIPCEQQWCR
jgi:hypothetical protein